MTSRSYTHELQQARHAQLSEAGDCPFCGNSFLTKDGFDFCQGRKARPISKGDCGKRSFSSGNYSGISKRRTTNHPQHLTQKSLRYAPKSPTGSRVVLLKVCGYGLRFSWQVFMRCTPISENVWPFSDFGSRHKGLSLGV